MKRLLAAILAGIMMLALTACGPATPSTGGNDTGSGGTDTGTSTGGGKIGVSMPTQSLQRWNQDGSNMKAELEKAGYEVDLQYAGDNDIPTQVNQIENMITSGCQALVIASIDGSSLTEVLKTAKDKNIPVIA